MAGTPRRCTGSGAARWSHAVAFGLCVASTVALCVSARGGPLTELSWFGASVQQASAFGAAHQPLRSAAAAPAGAGGYAFMMTQPDGTAVRWNRCRPIKYVVNRRQATPIADELLMTALQRVTALSGVVFEYGGPTDERAGQPRSGLDGARRGTAWAPVLIDWSSPQDVAGLAGDVAGYAGPVAVKDRRNGTLQYVSGQIVLDAPQLQRIIDHDGGMPRARAIVMHELAHLLGLDHVNDPSSLMNPATSTDMADFSEGDRRGLAELADGRCGK